MKKDKDKDKDKDIELVVAQRYLRWTLSSVEFYQRELDTVFFKIGARSFSDTPDSAVSVLVLQEDALNIFFGELNSSVDCSEVSLKVALKHFEKLSLKLSWFEDKYCDLLDLAERCNAVKIIIEHLPDLFGFLESRIGCRTQLYQLQKKFESLKNIYFLITEDSCSYEQLTDCLIDLDKQLRDVLSQTVYKVDRYYIGQINAWRYANISYPETGSFLDCYSAMLDLHDKFDPTPQALPQIQEIMSGIDTLLQSSLLVVQYSTDEKLLALESKLVFNRYTLLPPLKNKQASKKDNLPPDFLRR
jgi:hypothetical protein